MKAWRTALRHSAQLRCNCRLQYRALATEAAAAAPSTSTSDYPYSHNIRSVPRSPALSQQGPLMRRINEHLLATSPDAAQTAKHLWLFNRKNDRRALPGSVITVTYYTNAARSATTTFSGVLVAVARRNDGRDTSFRLRSVVARTGVEMTFKPASSVVKEVALVARADRTKAQKVSRSGSYVYRAKRAKLYYLRDQPKRMPNVASALKNRETLMARLKAKANPESAAEQKIQQTQQAKGKKKNAKKSKK